MKEQFWKVYRKIDRIVGIASGRVLNFCEYMWLFIKSFVTYSKNNNTPKDQ